MAGDRSVAKSLSMKMIDLTAGWIAAVRRGDVPAANRLSNRIGDAFMRLNAEGEAGLSEVELLLEHAVPAVRMAAAQDIMQRRPEKAIPVLGRLLIENLDDPSPWVRLEIRESAIVHLFIHFNIRSFNRDDLIEPLRSYGVVVPRSERREFA